jgi:hypothetical protein
MTALWEEILPLLGQRELRGRVTRGPLRLRLNLGRLAAGKPVAQRGRAARENQKAKGKWQRVKVKSRTFKNPC